MAWGLKNVVNIRKNFINDVLSKKLNISQACRFYQINRGTGYKWLKRFKSDDESTLVNRPLGRKTQSQKTPQEMEDIIVMLKCEYPTWGAKKFPAKLQERYPEISWPSKTTIENILVRNGLTQSRKTRLRIAENQNHLVKSENPNDVWCMDFKGWFLTKDNYKFDPFTLTDLESRFLLKCCKLNSNNEEHVWGLLDLAFREYGLPLYIRSDNGPPFATMAPGRLSKLAIKLIKAGITPEWIEPGKPQQNGQHERMHLTMEREGFIKGSSLKEQQEKLKAFSDYFNFERPHEALGQKIPGSVYMPSTRIWDGRLRTIEYTNEYKSAKVKECGKASWKGNEIYVSRVLSGERIGIKELENGYGMYYDKIFLGMINSDMRLEVKRMYRRNRIKS